MHAHAPFSMLLFSCITSMPAPCKVRFGFEAVVLSFPMVDHFTKVGILRLMQTIYGMRLAAEFGVPQPVQRRG